MRFYPVSQIVPLLIILLLAIGLRYHRASAGGITLDEQWHMELSTGRGSVHHTLPRDQIENVPRLTSLNGAAPVHCVWTNLSTIVHPPLYLLTLRIWREIFGEGDLPARVLSIACGLSAIALLYDAVRTMNGPRAALIAAIIFALAAMQTNLSQQVRGYAMLQMLGCGALAAAARLESFGAGSRRAVALGLCAAGMLLTHYFALFAVPALAIYLLLRLRGAARRQAIVAFIAAGVIFCTWLPFLARQIATARSASAEPWLAETELSTAQHFLKTLERAVIIPVRQISESPNVIGNWPLFAGLIFLVLIGVFPRRAKLGLWIVWLIGTIGAITLLDLVRSMHQLGHPRYTLLAAPAVFACIAAVGQTWRFQLFRAALPALAIVYAVLCLKVAYSRAGEAEWQALGDFVDHCPPQDVLIFYDGTESPGYSDNLLLSAAHYAKSFPRDVLMLNQPINEALQHNLAGRSAWLITGPLDRPLEQLLPGVRVQRTIQLETITDVAHVSFPPAN